MTNIPTIQQCYMNLESIKQIINGVEYWSARQLRPIVGYIEWRKFEGVIEKAKLTCAANNHIVFEHFNDSYKVVNSSKNSHREIEDYLLTRYAVYLIVMHGSVHKPTICQFQNMFTNNSTIVYDGSERLFSLCSNEELFNQLKP